MTLFPPGQVTSLLLLLLLLLRPSLDFLAVASCDQSQPQLVARNKQQPVTSNSNLQQQQQLASSNMQLKWQYLSAASVVRRCFCHYTFTKYLPALPTYIWISVCIYRYSTKCGYIFCFLILFFCLLSFGRLQLFALLLPRVWRWWRLPSFRFVSFWAPNGCIGKGLRLDGDKSPKSIRGEGTCSGRHRTVGFLWKRWSLHHLLHRFIKKLYRKKNN